ncbi:helix-turn-helix transcriptional regulator [Candidatus Albibeggiatoa sp. nov. BB20]|uniref:helix-turn-helix domain-containing protein n=1 Tax=Candidatus Albibeggiatoa sp. nov. BB20 TaxID=3162723 RepID=UPI00336569B5
MLTIGERLIKERKRLKMNQAQIAEIGKVTRPTQSSYENNQTKPDADYLALIAKAGVDINYVLIGSSKKINPNDYKDDFLEAMELKLDECQKDMHKFETRIQTMQQALSEIKK